MQQKRCGFEGHFCFSYLKVKNLKYSKVKCFSFHSKINTHIFINGCNIIFHNKIMTFINLNITQFQAYTCMGSGNIGQTYSTDFTKWDRFFISGWPALTLASPSLARAQARRDRRRIGCAQRLKWARAPTRFGPGKYTRPNPIWACTQYTVWRLTWML